MQDAGNRIAENQFCSKKNNSGQKNIFLHKMIGLWGPLIWGFIKWLAFGTLDLGPQFGTPI
jgi:hypothetical protein